MPGAVKVKWSEPGSADVPYTVEEKSAGQSGRHLQPADPGDRHPEEGQKVHLKDFGFVHVLQTVSKDGNADSENADSGESENGTVQYWATNDLQMTEEKREQLACRAWRVETYHRRLKQYCGVERSQHRRAQAQHNHIQMSIRAFLRLELHRVETAIRFYESKTAIIWGPFVRIWPTRPIFCPQVCTSYWKSHVSGGLMVGPA